MEDRFIVGCVEKVSIPAFGIENILAKVDTGAYSGVLHCEEIRVMNGVLLFIPAGQATTVEITDFEQRHVRSAHGHMKERYLVPITMEIQGKRFTTMIGIDNRSAMKYDMLLGRRFLRDNNILVDVKINEENDTEWELFEQ